MKKSLWMLTSSLICFTAVKADISAESLEPTTNETMLIAAAQQSSTQAQPKTKKSCMKANNPHRIDIKHIEAKGIGYNQGYTSLDGFFTSMWGDFIPFVDLRAHVFNNGRWAANAGLGARYIFDPCRWMVGGNAYYDYRSTKHGHYNQIGAGVEAFYDRFEAHLNGYLPVGQKRSMTKSHIESVTFKGFSGNFILQNENYNNTFEGAMKGFNGEVGAHIAGDRKCYDLYFGAGPYYYDVSSGKHAWGGKVRLKAEVTKYVFLEVSDSYDRIFHNRVQGTVNFSIPFGGKLCYPTKSADCANVMDWQAVLPVERQEIIVISKFKKKQTIDPVAINPVTGQPFFVIFVNNTNPNPNLGDGTFENPFVNLTTNDNSSVNAQNVLNDGNILYVFAGDGSDTGMQGGGLQLQPNNRMLGSANSHLFQTTKGLLTIPALTTLVPNVQGSSVTTADVILLANNCEVSGFNISQPVGSTFACINGVPSSAPLINSNINHNTLTNGQFAVIFGQASVPNIATGTLLVENNAATGQNASSFAFQFQGVQNAAITFANNTTNLLNCSATNVQTLGGTTISMTNNTLDIAGTTGSGLRAVGITGGSALPDQYTITGNTFNGARTIAMNSNNTNNITTVIAEENAFLNGNTAAFITAGGNTGAWCIRFNNNKGFPSSVSPPYSIGAIGAGTINLEPPTNNFPQPTTAGTSPVAPCACAPCN